MSEFYKYLAQYRQQARLTKSKLAKMVSIDASYISLLEANRREPSRDMVVKIGRTLNLGLDDLNTLLVSAQYAPMDFNDIREENPTVKLLADLLENNQIPNEDKREIEDVINRHLQLLIRRYQKPE